jgi:uncharacterized repeat protein (TIGR01451 family)
MTVGLVAVAAPSASAAPWTCSSFGYLFQTPNATTHEVYQVDLVSGASSLIGSNPDNTNAVGFNVLDNYIYGVQRVTVGPGVFDSTIVRVNSDGTVVDLGTPAGMVANDTYGTGDVDPNGHYWFMSNGFHWYEVDLAPGSPTYGQVLNQGTVSPSSTGFNVSGDWAWINGALYSTSNTVSGPAHLIRWTPAGGTEDLGTITGLGLGGAYGALYTDAAGYLYGSNNTTGEIYRIDPSSRQAILVTPNGPKSQGNDGARCATAPIPTITVTKTVAGRIVPADQFTVGLQNSGGSVLTSATTAGPATTASTINWPVSQGATYTITDAMAAGSTSPLGEYTKSIVCTDGAGNVVATGGAAPNWTLTVANATYYTCNVTNKPETDLEITKTASPNPSVPGTNETYSLKVTNHGPSTAINVRVSDPLPAPLSFVSASSGCAEANKTVTCTLASLAPGASHTFTVTAKIASSAKDCADVRNTATVTNDIVDTNLTNNSSSACPVPEGRSDLKITKVPSRTTVPSGGQVMYTLVVENLGPSDDTGVKVTDPMAQGLSLVSAKPSQGFCSTTGGQVSCNLGSLAAGGSAQILVTANVTATSGCITNTSTVTGDAKDPTADNNKDSAAVCVTPPPPGDPKFDLVVDKTASSKSVYVGQPVTYTITVTNKGPDTATDAKLTDTLNAPVSVISVKPTQGSCTKKIPMSCQLGTIPAGGKVTITVKVKHRDSGCKQRNAASATGEGTDTNPANNLDRVDICVKQVPLRLTKVADRHTLRAGDLVGYTIRVSNPTAGEAKDVDVCDKLPSGLVYVSSKARAKFTKGQYCWHIETLGAHKSRSYRITVRALGSASGDRTNRATASAPGARTRHAKDAVHVLAARVSGGGVTG